MSINRTKSDAAYLELREQILSGALPPGSVLDQVVLARNLQVSTTPVREALRRLEAENLVITSPHREARVAPLSLRELRDLCTVRLELDPLAAAECALKASDEEIDHIVSLIRPRAERPHSTDHDANREFHRQIYLHSHNPVLVPILDSLWSKCDRYRFLLIESNYSEFAPDDHERIATALVQRRAAHASALLREHLSRSFSEMVRRTSDILDRRADPAAERVGVASGQGDRVAGRPPEVLDLR
jgi:DNA-binding GntR family transcriptional regulator